MKNLIGKLFGGKKVSPDRNASETPDDFNEKSLKEYCDQYVNMYGAGIFLKEDFEQGLKSCKAPLSPRVITETPEPTVPRERISFLEIMEKVQGHIGLPQGVVQTMHTLDKYCHGEKILGLANHIKNKGYSVKVKFGKGLFEINYDTIGAYKDINSEFRVEGPVFA